MILNGGEEYVFSDSILSHQSQQQRRPTRRCNKCFVYAFFGFDILCIILLIFSLIVLRPSHPRVRLTSTAVKTLSYGSNNNNNSSASPWFNGTLSGEVTIKNNNNFGRFKFGNSSASFSYGGVVVGEANLEGGSVEAKGETKREIVVQLKSSASMMDSSKLNGDVSKNGSLEICGFARLVGKMHLIKVFEFTRTSVMNCTMSLDLTRSSVQGLVCQ